LVLALMRGPLPSALIRLLKESARHVFSYRIGGRDDGRTIASGRMWLQPRRPGGCRRGYQPRRSQSRAAGLAVMFSRDNAIRRIFIMRKNVSLAFTLLALIGLVPLLGACHTAAGAGEDLSAGGHAITNSAEKHTP
jgi:predicted small secreted protein